MSDRSKNSKAALARPFDPHIEAMAAKIAGRYRVILAHEGGTWFGSGVEMPDVFGEGRTVEECVRDTREALKAAAAVMLEQGETPPMPADEGQRTEQVNVRLSSLEKTVLTGLARSSGHKGLGDYIRSAALAGRTQRSTHAHRRAKPRRALR
jgi:predicted RNase H-like HicB family nuclease